LVSPLYIKKVRTRVPKARLTRFLRAIERHLQKKHAQLRKPYELVLVFVSANEVARLNKKYRQKRGPTDVLSFAATDPDSLGELVLCPQVIRRQAQENGWSEFNEFAYMVLHGVLHLLGYDHEKDDKNARQMYRLQDTIYFQVLKEQNPNERRNRTDRN
jgi:probable rRNA maturation factor